MLTRNKFDPNTDKAAFFDDECSLSKNCSDGVAG